MPKGITGKDEVDAETGDMTGNGIGTWPNGWAEEPSPGPAGGMTEGI